MKNRIFLYTILIIASSAFFSCTEEKKPTGKSTASDSPDLTEKTVAQTDTTNRPGIYEVSIEKFEQSGMELEVEDYEDRGADGETVSAAGYLMIPVDSKAEVSVYIGGYMQSCSFLPGDYVTRGQFLISLESLEYIRIQQDYLKAKEQLKYLKTVYERQTTLASENIASENSRQQAESEYKSARADLEGLKKMLQMINIDTAGLHPGNISSTINLYAPIAGYITKVNAVKGKFADPAEIIFEIINTNNLYVELKVYEKDILKIRKGQKITFSVPEATSTKYSGTIFMVGKTINEKDRTITVYCHISDISKVPSVVGMYVEAEIHTGTQQAFCIPQSALLTEDGRSYVFVKTSSDENSLSFKKIPVETQQTVDDCVEITGAGIRQLKGREILVKGMDVLLNLK